MSTQVPTASTSDTRLQSAIAQLLSPDAEAEIHDFKSLYHATNLGSADFADKIAELFQLARASFQEIEAGTSQCEHFSTRFIRAFNFYPFRAEDNSAIVAIAEPPSAPLTRAVEMVMQGPVVFKVVSYDEIGSLLAAHLTDLQPTLDQPDATANTENIENLRDIASGAPVVRAVNDLFEKAIEIGATDLHLEPMRDSLTIRYRVDGVLRRHGALPKQMAPAIMSRIKILAGLNIAERRLPQDGSLRVTLNTRLVDMRVAVLPSSMGESCVIRFLPVDKNMLDISRLGVSATQEQQLRRLIEMPHGIIIITGPTGSGKTTTLAASLTTINTPTRKILTIEDPIEYELPGIIQAQTAPGIGFTFPVALRSFLRLDPDVIMLGEIRDTDTAQIAIQAALTGHLVLTTLHTNSAAAAIPRLIDLGVQDFLLQSTLRGVLAQRLIRRLCTSCKTPYEVTASMIASDPRYSSFQITDGTRLYRPSGCQRCGNTGYHGRMGIFEILEFSPTLIQMIRKYEDDESIQQVAMENGFEPLSKQAAQAIRHGYTDIDEVMRVIAIR